MKVAGTIGTMLWNSLHLNGKPLSLMCGMQWYEHLCYRDTDHFVPMERLSMSHANTEDTSPMTAEIPISNPVSLKGSIFSFTCQSS
jgi:hypothetical protein